MAKLMLTGVAGTDTESEFILKVDNVTIDHTAVTRARFKFTGSTLALDSSVYPSAWSFASAGKLVCKLGRGDLVPGRYRGRLITHDAGHPNGQAWDTDMELTIL